MRRRTDEIESIDVWPVLSDTVVAFLLVLVLLLVFQVGRNIEVVADTAQLAQSQVDQRKVEDVVSDLASRYSNIRIRRTGLSEHEVTLGAGALFPLGRATLSPEGRQLLAELVSRILEEELPSLREITVKGHTDSIPISNSQFASNWELSTARASRVVRFLIDGEAGVGIDPDRVRFVAAGYSHYSPVGSDADENRRIELRVVYSSIVRSEPPGA